MLGEGAAFPRSAVTLPNPPWPQLHGFKAPERLLHFSDRSRILVPALVGTVDLLRFDRVIIKGLFYTERGVRLPSTYLVVSYSMAGLTRVPTAVGRPFRAIIELLMAREPKYVGGPQFVFWSDYDSSDANQSTWLLVIHRHHFFIGWTRQGDNDTVRHRHSPTDDPREAKD